MKKSNLVAIGLRAKTARAIAVVLGGSIDSPIVIAKTEIRLADPKMPGTAQPYHEVMDLPWEESQRAALKYIRAIENVATKELARLIDEQRSGGMKIAGVGIVGAQDRDLARIGNNHIRAHAAEGVLFRRVLDLAAEANGLKRRTFPDRDFDALAATELGAKSVEVKQKILHLGRSVPAPWRADEKQAAMAAWLVLHLQ
jgi:hypothetical protein